MKKTRLEESERRFRRSTLAAAVGLALAVSTVPALAVLDGPGGPDPAQPGSYFTAFADGPGGAPDPVDLAAGMLLDGGGVSVTSAAFQGNTGVSASIGGYGYYEGGFDGPYFGGYDGSYYGGYAPDTVLGQFPGAIPPGAPTSPLPAPIQTDDDSSPLGDGLADAFIATPTSGQLTLGVSGFDDFDFNGLSDGSEDSASPGSGEPHYQEGLYVLYLSVMDGVNDPDFSGGSDSSGVDSGDAYNPSQHADLAIAAYLGDDSPDDVDTFSFDAGTSDSGDGSFMLEPGAFVAPADILSVPGNWLEFGLYGAYGGLPPGIGDPATDPLAAAMVQNFLDLLDGGANVAAVLDNDPLGGYGGYGGFGGYTDFFGSASFVDDMNLGTGPGGEDLNFGDGILLTSGVGTPPDENTSGSFTGTASGLGDAALDQILAVGGDQGLIDDNVFSTDATVLTFDFTVPDGSNAVELDFMFGTEEFPNWNYPDVAIIAIDGVNYAIFPDGTPTIFDPDTPIADILLDNNGIPGPYAIEYDGISPVRNMIAPLADLADGATHTFKAAVSDARDQIYDTGLFLANFAATTVPAGTDPSDPVLPTPGDDPTDGFDFRINLGDAGLGLDPSTPIWIDPDIAIGYTYSVSGSTFASATLPSGYGDDLYTVSWWDPTANGGVGAYVQIDGTHAGDQFMAGEIINFLSVDAGGVIGFQVLGIEISANLDPTDPTAFMTGVSFTSGGTTIGVNMSPITTFVNPNPPGVPEPGILFLMGSGMLAFGAMRRRQRRVA